MRGESMLLKTLVCALAMFGSVAGAHSHAKGTLPFTVRDSIEMTRVVAFDDTGFDTSEVALFSPDRSKFIVHTRRGDIGRNVTVESLLLFEVADVLQRMSTRSDSPPIPRKLVEFAVGDDSGAMSNVRWLSDRSVGFVGQRTQGAAQAFRVDVTNGKVDQLTRHSTDVTSFAAAADRVLYYAVAPEEAAQVRVVDGKLISDALAPNSLSEYPRVDLFSGSLQTGQVTRVRVPTMRLGSMNQGIWLSPSGRYAITLAPTVNAPSYWSEYQLPNYDFFGYTADRVRSDPTSMDLIFRHRYQLINLELNVARSLLDAPTGGLAINYSPLQAFWPDDDRVVVVANTFLPLRNGAAEIDSARRRSPALAEVDLTSGNETVIAWEPARHVDPTTERGRKLGSLPEQVVSIEWLPDARLLVRIKRVGEATIVESFQRQKNKWSARRRPQPRQSSLSISLQQGMNERPKLYASGTACRCRRVVFDPWPEADRFAFGHAEVLQWTDANGIAWKGGLILPPAYTPSHAYPTVVQTHGFKANEFLIDGPSGVTTAFAARALSSAGFVVLQVEENSRAETMDAQEGHLYAEGIRAGIRTLIEKGIADPAHVGYIGWSRSGFHALYLLAEYPRLLAAATISDSFQPGYVSHMLNVNHVRDLTAQMDKVTGGPPRIGNLDEWMRANPLYQLNGIAAPVRLEAIGPGSLMHVWETYALLRYARQPVDLMYFPDGSHVLTKPVERLASQGGNVDWFKFWLQKVEDADPVKSAQYQRWDNLRRQMLLVQR